MIYRSWGTKRLPRRIEPFFWDCDLDRLRWEEHRDFITKRILLHGNWDSIRWLRSRTGEDAIKEWILRHKGGQLPPPQLRFWELVLQLSKRQVTSWIKSRRQSLWEQRTLQ